MKVLLANLLRPLIKLVYLGQAWGRLWSYACLRAQLPQGLDASCVVLGCPEIHGTRAVILGRDLYLYRDLHLETRESGSISIGDQAVISRGVHIVAFSGVSIGAGSMIGEYASIRDANHRHGTARPLRDAGHNSRAISIGRDVWIGRGAIVLPGVRIGDRAVVGANAVVTRDVAVGSVVAGVPARPIHPGEQS